MSRDDEQHYLLKDGAEFFCLKPDKIKRKHPENGMVSEDLCIVYGDQIFDVKKSDVRPDAVMKNGYVFWDKYHQPINGFEMFL